MNLFSPLFDNNSFSDVQPMDLDDLFLYKENAFTGLQAYKNSKTANIMFTYKMSKTLESSNVTINAICPGFY